MIDKQPEVVKTNHNEDETKAMLKRDQEKFAVSTKSLADNQNNSGTQPEVQRPTRSYEPKASAQLFEVAQDVRVGGKDQPAETGEKITVESLRKIRKESDYPTQKEIDTQMRLEDQANLEFIRNSILRM